MRQINKNALWDISFANVFVYVFNKSSSRTASVVLFVLEFEEYTYGDHTYIRM